MAATYRFKILTPGDMILDEDVVSMIAPGKAGFLGILANHAPILTTLQPGTLRVKTESTEKWFEIDSGILRVAANNAVLLSESVKEVPAGS